MLIARLRPSFTRSSQRRFRTLPRVDELATRLAEMWHSSRVLARLAIVLMALAAIAIVGTVIYSFLLPVTG